MAQKYI